ncbi:odorant receptor 47a-like isoform X2 [Atheta coriaria]
MITLVVHIIVYYTIYIMMIHIPELDEFMHDLNDYTRFGKPPGIDTADKYCNYFTYFFYLYGWIGSILYSLSSVLDKAECEERDVHKTRECGFLVPLRFPYKIDTLEKFIVTWLLQNFSLNLLLTSGITIMSYLYSSVENFNAKIVHLKSEITKLGDRPELVREEIKFCVDYHVKIIEMCKNLNKCWGKLMLYHQMMVTILESLIGIQFLLDPDPKYMIHGTAWLISLAIPCYAGQRLLDESSEIPLAIYSSKWYNLDNQSMKDLVYMLMCANNYLDLNRDGYGPINLSIVGNVINNIYSVLMLLYSTMSEL